MEKAFFCVIAVCTGLAALGGVNLCLCFIALLFGAFFALGSDAAKEERGRGLD